MRFKHVFITLALVGCVKHATVEPPVRSEPIYAADKTWAYYPDGPSGWTVVSKTGSAKAVKELCPKGAICTVEELGILYRIRRVGNK